MEGAGKDPVFLSSLITVQLDLPASFGQAKMSRLLVAEADGEKRAHILEAASLQQK